MAIQAARAKLEAIFMEAPDILDADTPEKLDAHNEHFKERDTIGWYLNSIDVAATVAERAVAKDRPWEAVVMGMEIGELFAEMRFKALWEEAALFGNERMGELRDAAEARRKQSAQERFEEVELYRSRGHALEDCYRFVGKKFRVSPSTIKQDYLRLRKLGKPLA